jgi:hypothetical protein
MTAKKKPEPKKPAKKAMQAPKKQEAPKSAGTTIRTGLPKAAKDRLKIRTGRPHTYTREAADTILAKIAEGKSLASICKEDPNLPPASTFRSWVIDDVDGLSARSARAYSIGHDAIADECIQIADEPPGINPMTGATDGGDVQHKRLRIDSRLRLLGKWAPKKYGDKLEIDGKLDTGIADLVRAARERAKSGRD